MRFAPISFSHGDLSIFPVGGQSGRDSDARVIMAVTPNDMSVTPNDRWGEIKARLRHARMTTADIVIGVRATACARLSAPGFAAQASWVDRLIEAQAWTDAALAIVQVELPQWTVRRIMHEDGEWRCTLGRRWQLPDWLDDSAEGSHEILPLAILSAFVEARCTDEASAPASRLVPQVGPASGQAICCDNFV